MIVHESTRRDALVARCIVCRGDIHLGDAYELWEGAYYCERHSLPLLRERARQYAALLQAQAVSETEST